MRKNNKKQTRTVKHDHPGRPKYTLRLPTRKEFTFQDILEVNGVETNPAAKNYGKGENCSLLTVRKNLKRDMYILHPKSGKILRVNPRSRVCLVKGVTAEPNSTTGLGRRALVYCLRENKDNVSKPTVKTATPKAAKATRKARTPKATSQTPTADALDAIHKALATPDPVVPAPVVETPAPVAEKAPETLTVPGCGYRPDPDRDCPGTRCRDSRTRGCPVAAGPPAAPATLVNS